MIKKNIKNLLDFSYVYSIISKGIHIFLGIFISIFINRALGTQLKGEYAYICTLISLFTVIGGFGIYQLYPFYIRNNNKKEEKEKFINLTINLSLIYFIALFTITLIILLFYDIYLGCLFFISANVGVLSILSTQLAMFTSIEDFKKAKLNNIKAYIVKFIVLFIIFLFFKKNIWLIIVTDLSFYLLLSNLYLNVLQFKYHYFYWDKNFLFKTIKKGIVPMFFSLLLTLNYKLDIICLKFYCNIAFTDIGLYAVGIQLAEYIWVIPDIFKEVLYSKTDKDININETLWCLRLSFYIELIFLIFILILGEKIVILLYGEDFVNSTKIIKIIFSGILAMTLFKILTPLYNAKGVFWENLSIIFISICINIILNIILIPKYGTTGAALASVCGYSICGVIYLIRFCKEFNIPIYKIIFFNYEDLKTILKSN